MLGTLKDTALIDPTDISGLLGYYREKVAYLEAERNNSIADMERLKVPQKDKHDLEWENYRLKNTVEELNKTLRELKIKFFEERTLIIQLKNQNNCLNEDLGREKHKADELLAHNTAVEEKVVLKEGKKPKFHHKFVRNPSMKDVDKTSKVVGNLKTTSYTMKSEVVITHEGAQQAKQQPAQMTSGVFEPTTNQKISRLETEKAVLLKHVEDLKAENTRLEDKLQNDIGIKNKEIERLLTESQKVDRINIEINKELLKQRTAFSSKDDKLNKELETLKVKLVKMSSILADYERQAATEKLFSVKLAESKSKESLEAYKRQVIEKEQSINIVRKQYEEVQKIFKERLETLSEENRQLKAKLEKTQKTKKLHLEGADNENKYLKERISEVEAELELERHLVRNNGGVLASVFSKPEEMRKTKKRDKRSGSRKSGVSNPIENLRKTIEEISKKYDN